MRKIHKGRKIVNLLKTEPDGKLRQGAARPTQMEFAFVVGGLGRSNQLQDSGENAETKNQQHNPKYHENKNILL